MGIELLAFQIHVRYLEASQHGYQVYGIGPKDIMEDEYTVATVIMLTVS